MNRMSWKGLKMNRHLRSCRFSGKRFMYPSASRKKSQRWEAWTMCRVVVWKCQECYGWLLILHCVVLKKLTEHYISQAVQIMYFKYLWYSFRVFESPSTRPRLPLPRDPSLKVGVLGWSSTCSPGFQAGVAGMGVLKEDQMDSLFLKTFYQELNSGKF